MFLIGDENRFRENVIFLLLYLFNGVGGGVGRDAKQSELNFRCTRVAFRGNSQSSVDLLRNFVPICLAQIRKTISSEWARTKRFPFK